MEVRNDVGDGNLSPEDHPHEQSSPALSKQVKSSPHPVDTNSVTQRLQKELMALMDKWSSAYDCRTILLSIQSLLGEPNNESPLNSSAAALWKNQEDYRKMVRKYYYLSGEVSC
ncbi:uncharacterized protein [Coffea arabica]|uniref:Uncharacterized protein isoform X3 n=1 Tax=Coffea arabica TaxID=13443 RepID=A0ABM4WND2_COFAR